MTIDISVGTVGAACTVATLAGKIVHSLFSSALEKRDDRIAAMEKASDDKDRELEGAFKAVRDTQKTLFDKLDAAHNDLQAYKLHVAEHYVGEAKLEKLIAPVLTRLDSIERDLRRERGGVA